MTAACAPPSFPEKAWDKIYYAKIKGIVTEEDVRLFEKGVHIGDEKPTMPAALEILSRTKRTAERKDKRAENIASKQNETDEKEDGYSEIYLKKKRWFSPQEKGVFRGGGKRSCLFKRIQFGTLTLDPSLKTRTI